MNGVYNSEREGGHFLIEGVEHVMWDELTREFECKNQSVW